MSDRNATIFFLASALFLLAIMAAQARAPEGGSVLSSWASAVVRPLGHGVLGIAGGVRSAWDNTLGLYEARRERDALRERLAFLEAEAARAEELERENRRLAELLELKRFGDFEEGVAARVVADLSGGPMRHAVLVDKGLVDGVNERWVMLHRGAVAGRVLHAGRGSAEVLLIVDPDSGVAVRHQAGRFSGVLRGGNRGASRIASLEYVPRDQAVAAGDVVVTSGLDGLYPPGLRVGRVRRVEGSSPLTWQIDVEVEADPASLEEVLLIPPFEPVEEGEAEASRR